MQATLLTLAIAAILALLAALLGPYFVDWNAHRATFEEQASQAIGLPVRVTGPMDVRLLPSPTLVLSGVEIGKPDDPQAVRAKALGIEFALPPLLSGKLRAVELRLIAPEMRVSLTQDGRAVFPNALSGMNTEALSIDKLVIEDARLDFSDAASGTQASFSKLWFKGEVRSLPGPIRGEGAFVMDGALYGYRIATARPEANGSRIKVTIDPSDRPVYAEVEGFLSADGGTPRFEGQATMARRMPAKEDKVEPWRVTARVKANAAAALFEQVEYQYGPDERALKLFGTAEAKFGAEPRLDAVLSARTLDADKLLAVTGGTNLPPRAALAALVAAAERIIGPPIPTQIGFGVDALTLGGTSLQNIRGDIEFGRGGMTLSGFELRAPGFTQLQASGRMEKAGERLSFIGPVDVSSGDPRAFADWLEGKTGATALPARPLRLRGEVTLAPDKIAIERMRAEFDRKSFDGSLAYMFAKTGERSRFDATLRADELDLDALMDAAGSIQAVADIERPDDVSLALSLGRLRFAGLDGEKADLRLALAAGELSVERLAIADLAGIAIAGKGRLDMKSQRGSVSFDLAMRDSQQLSALSKRAPAFLAESLQRAAQAAAPAKLAGTVTVEPAGRAGDSRLTVAAEGPLGAIQLKLKTALSGRWADLRQAEIALDGSLDAGDVNELLKLAAADRAISVPRQPGTYTLALKGKLDGDVRVDTRIVSANLDARANGNIRPFASDGKSGSLDIAVGSADLVIAHAPNRKSVPVTLKTRLATDAFGMKLDDLSATIAGSAVRGRLAVGFGEIPAIDGELRTDKIDIASVFAAAVGLDRSPDARIDGKWSDIPFAFPPLPPLSGQVTVSAAQAVLSPLLQASKFRSVLRFADMAVTAEGVDAELLGGRLSADIAMQRGGDGLGFQGRIAITDADATQLLFGGPAPLTGSAALTLQLEGLGRSARALVGSLNGSGTLELDNARFTSLDPKVFAAATHAVDHGLPIDASRIRDLAARALDAGPLAASHVKAELTVAAGVVRIESFEARAGANALNATGSYNLADSRVDLRLAMTGSETGASIPPEIAVQLRGQAAAPERVLDVSALTGWLALRSVDRHTKKLEAIEQGRAVDAALPLQQEPPAVTSSTPVPVIEVPVLPRPRPAPPQPAAELPPPVEIKPAAGDRRRTLPQQRFEPPRPGGANPFPEPIGSPPPAPQVRQPLPPQSVRPIF